MSKRRYGGGSVTQYTYRNKTRSVKKWRYQIWEPIDYSVPDGETRLRGKSGFSTAKDAEKALAEHRRRIEEQKPQINSKTTVEQYSQEWLNSLRGLANSTLAGYRNIINLRINPALGNVELQKLTPSKINTFYTDLLNQGNVQKWAKGKPLSPNSVRKTHNVLAAMLDAAIIDDKLTVNPARSPKVNAPKNKEVRAAQPEITVWEHEQIVAFVDWNEKQGDDFNTLWRLAANTGLRRGEILALRWGDFDPVTQKLSVRRAIDNDAKIGATKLPKGGKSRVIDLLPRDSQMLGEWKKLRAQISFEFIKADAYIFGTNDTNRLRYGDNLTQRFMRQVAKAQATDLPDLPTIHFHELRHSHATQLLRLGIQPKVVQERLGHADITITLQTYSHLLPSIQQDAVAKLAAAYE